MRAEFALKCPFLAFEKGDFPALTARFRAKDAKVFIDRITGKHLIPLLFPKKGRGFASDLEHFIFFAASGFGSMQRAACRFRKDHDAAGRGTGRSIQGCAEGKNYRQSAGARGEFFSMRNRLDPDGLVFAPEGTAADFSARGLDTGWAAPLG